MDRIEIINHLIKRNNYTSYLEIGIFQGECFNAIKCKDKTGVDPDFTSKCDGELHHLTSDEFFGLNKKKYGLIFIDGLHMAEQVKRDLLNALSALELGGTIVVHDCNPLTDLMQQVPFTTQFEWTGDVWKAWIAFRKNGFKQYVVDTDFGVGILTEGKVPPFICTEELTYENLDKNRVEWLNLVSVDWFLEHNG